MNPVELIGMGYRLGASPARHGKADCFSLAATVVNWYGLDAPKPQRDWYRRLRRHDYSVFQDELEAWGEKVAAPRIGSVALCLADKGYGLAVWYQEGWLSFADGEVIWSPREALRVIAIYEQTPRQPLCKP